MPGPSLHAAPPRRRDAFRIDTERLRQQHPVADVVRRYGVELRRSGSSFTGRCPFHADGGRPNFVVFPRSGRWVCFRCGVGGDVIAFVQQLEQVSFREAAAHLGAELPGPAARPTRPQRPPARDRTVGRELGADDHAVLDAAVELYANRLLADEEALAYMVGRGFRRELLERERVGYAAGDELVRYLAWRRLPIGAARRTGLLRADGREYLAGRIIFPEMRKGQPVWLIGRILGPDAADEKYLGLPGRKPLLGWEEASRDLRGVCLVEGPTDWLAVRQWGVPALALCGTGLAPETLALLERGQRLYAVLDNDQAGQEATARLVDALGSRVIPVALPPGIKDPGELATRSDGGELFGAAIRAVAARAPRLAMAPVQA